MPIPPRQPAMSSLLRQTLKYGHLRRLGCPLHGKDIRSISSTGRLKDAPRPTLKAEADVPKAEDNEFDPYEPLRTREKPALLQPIMFTLGVGLCTFAGAAYLTRRESLRLAQSAMNTDASVDDLRHERMRLELKQANATYSRLHEVGCPGFITRSYAWLENHWLNYSDGERLGLGLVAVNTVVFLAWQIPLPAARFFMVKHFMHHPLSGRSYTLLTAVFSHMVSYFSPFPSSIRKALALISKSV
jgi:hypothetical protein